MLNRKLPPYSKTLQALQDQNIRIVEDVYIFMGKESWNKAKHFQSFRPTTMCLPNYASPYDFTWPVSGCEIMLFDTSDSNIHTVQHFIACLFIYGAKVVWFITFDFQLTIYKKDF